VTAGLGANSKLPLDLLEAWITVSYRAIAPKLRANALPAKILSGQMPSLVAG
jgi:hypothetical protein